MNIRRTFLKLWNSQCRFGTYHVRSRLISAGEDIPMFNEFCHRRLHCILNASLNARKSERSEPITSEGKEAAKNISQWWIDYKKRRTFKERCVSKITRALECSEQRANLFTDNDSLTFLDKIDYTIEIIEYLIQNGFSVDGIRSNTTILRLSKNDIEFRVEHVKKWGIDPRYYSEFLTLFRLPTAEFILISNALIKEKEQNIPDGNRVIHFAKILDVPIARVNRAFLRCRQLYKYKFEDIRAALQCYLDFGVEPEYILKDISGLRMDVETIKRRLSGPFKEGLQPLRPNLVMCSKYLYLRKCKELKENVNWFAPYENAEEYISAKVFSQKHHMSDHKKKKILMTLASVEPKNLINITEFALEKNYNPDQIFVNMDIFGYDVELLKERYTAYQNAGIPSPTLKMLTKAQDLFEQALKRAESNNTEARELMAVFTSLRREENDESNTGIKNE